MTLIDSLRNDPKFSPANSQKWFINKVKEMTGGTRISSMEMLAAHQTQLVTKIMPGEMYMFSYDPKHKKTLPLYDRFPLLLPFNKDANSFIGLNLHYLRPLQRIALLDKLMEFAKNDRAGNPQRFNLSWNFLKNASKFPQVQGCVKMYLNGYVKSRFIRIKPEDWALTCVLPTESFVKGKPY